MNILTTARAVARALVVTLFLTSCATTLEQVDTTTETIVPGPKPKIVSAAVPWPNGAKAALALTYDDSLNSHLDIAAPALDKYGYKGTFYLTIERPGFFARLDEWKILAANGHELGNHTIFHPCSSRGPDASWVRPGDDLDRYSVDRIVRELAVTNGVLNMVDGETSRSYAYTCAEAIVGGDENYIDAIRDMFPSARSALPQEDWIAVGEFDPMSAPTYSPPHGGMAEALIAYVEDLRQRGGLGTLTFHGIGGDYLAVSGEAHENLLAHLKKHEDEIWVAPFEDIMAFVLANQPE